jgi:2-polyprenyl-3-methyl-5-hydroxy-6-metoxy-1,4-benzoquinol methylase
MNAAGTRACWCGHPELHDYSPAYRVCKACGTLVSQAPLTREALEVRKDTGELYSKDYWLKRQQDHHGLPDIRARSRLDLPERCTHWLRHLLSIQPPPAAVLEIGCAHGGYVALMRAAGYDARGTEMSPWIVQYAQETFGVPVTAGPIEQQAFPAGSFDVLVLNDVLEHLPDPVATMRHCAKLLKPDGVFVIQTPEYKEHLTFADLVATKDIFLRHIEHNWEEHLYLFSRRSAGMFFERLGFPVLDFENPVYSYDMFFTAARTSRPRRTAEEIAGALMSQPPPARLVLALLDKAYESNDRWWAIQRLENQLRQTP